MNDDKIDYPILLGHPLPDHDLAHRFYRARPPKIAQPNAHL